MIVVYSQYDVLGLGETEEKAMSDAKERFDFNTGNTIKYFANISTKASSKLRKCFDEDLSFDFKIRYNKKSKTCLITC